MLSAATTTTANFNSSFTYTTLSFNQSFVHFTIPFDHTDLTNIQYSSFVQCHQYKRKHYYGINGSCTGDLFDHNTRLSCDRFVFDHAYFESTIVTEVINNNNYYY